MPRCVRVVCVLTLGLALMGQEVRAQGWYYPRGYGGYGWGGWGADPASGYMAGLGAFARGRGVYEVEHAKAQALNLQTMIKWNQALRARQKQLDQDQRKADAQRLEQQKERVAELNLADGTTLNDLLSQIMDLDPAAARSSRAKSTLGASAVGEIPFEWNTEAVSLCLDQMLGRDALPATLMDPRFDAERQALGQAVKAAIEEDAKGDVSPKAAKRVSDAIANFRAKFVKLVPETFSGYTECADYFNTLASLTRMLHDPSMRKALAELENERDVTVGRLIAFMQSYNLRFGPATTERQVRIYQSLADRLGQVARDVTPSPSPARTPAQDPNALPSAAKEAFKGIGWDQLDAHSRTP
jgi:hypothetical protein